MLPRVLTIAALSACLLASSAPALDIVRESTPHRAELDRMELTNFQAEAWSKLTAWANGEALTAVSMDGKPVLIMTWASWHPASLKTLSIAQNAMTRYGPQGLIVVGVHNQQGWDNAASQAKTRNLSFPIAHDSAGEFRKVLKIDHDPMFYLIDRAGHLRYAAIASGSVEEACAKLVGETKEQASDVPRIRKEEEDARAGLQRRTSEINKTVDLSSLPPVPPGYIQPQANFYKIVEWPKLDLEEGKKYGLIDQTSNKFVEKKLAFSPASYYPTKPETQGRAIVIYIWHPDIPESYQRSMPQMDLLQQQYQRDLAVIGAAIPLRTLLPQRQAQPGEEEETAARLAVKYASFISSRHYKHALAADVSGSSLSSVTSSGSDGFPIPGAMVVSSDGVIRWVGSTNSSNFKYAIETIVAVDPAVRARREADRKFIEAAAK